MTDQKPTVTTQARLNSLSSSLITRGLALLAGMTEDRNLHVEAAPREASPMWTFIGYGEQLSPDQRKGDQRPETQPVLPTSIPEELKERPQWVCWDWSWRETASGRQHWAKPPLSAVTRGAALETDPRTWTSFDEAWNFANRFHLPGVGYVFLGDDPFAGIDIDHCRKPREGEIDREAIEIVSALHSYTEISPSGEGLHIIVRGKLADDFYRHVKAQPERFDREQYFTMTGQHLTYMPLAIHPREDELRRLPQNHTGGYYSGSANYEEDPSIRAVILHGDQLLVLRWNGFINALDVVTGVPRWDYYVGGSFNFDTSIDDRIFIYDGKELITIASATGNVLWRRYNDRPVRTMYTRAGMLFLFEEYATLQVLNTITGGLKWSFSSDNSSKSSSDVWKGVGVFENHICVLACDVMDFYDEKSTCPYDAYVLDAATGAELSKKDLSRPKIFGVICRNLRQPWSWTSNQEIGS